MPATALQGNQLQKVLTGPVITATMGLPPAIASSLLQQHVNAAFSSQQQSVNVINKNVVQTDGAASDSDDQFEIEICMSRPGKSAKKGSISNHVWPNMFFCILRAFSKLQFSASMFSCLVNFIQFCHYYSLAAD